MAGLQAVQWSLQHVVNSIKHLVAHLQVKYTNHAVYSFQFHFAQEAAGSHQDGNTLQETPGAGVSATRTLIGLLMSSTAHRNPNYLLLYGQCFTNAVSVVSVLWFTYIGIPSGNGGLVLQERGDNGNLIPPQLIRTACYGHNTTHVSSLQAKRNNTHICNMYMDRGTADTEICMGFTGTSLTRVWGFNSRTSQTRHAAHRSPSYSHFSGG